MLKCHRLQNIQCGLHIYLSGVQPLVVLDAVDLNQVLQLALAFTPAL